MNYLINFNATLFLNYKLHQLNKMQFLSIKIKESSFEDKKKINFLFVVPENVDSESDKLVNFCFYTMYIVYLK